MANSSEQEENSVESLLSMFNEGLDLFNKLSNNSDPTNSPAVQADIKAAIKIFEEATRLVSYAGLFSTNEGIDEVSTNDLQYFLLPALLGTLTTKLTNSNRKEIVEVAEIYFKDFLSRCNDYNLSNFVFNAKVEQREPKNEFQIIEAAVNTRANKIQRFKEQKELKSKLADLKKNMANEHVDEDIKREYFITMIKTFIHEAIEELSSIEMEKQILEHKAQMKDNDEPEPSRQLPPPLKPVIITKDEVQKAVFGAGYPSLPTMTVKEFYDKRVQDGIFPDPNKKPSGPLSLQQATLQGVNLTDEEKEAEEKERAIERDDPEQLERMRRMDEFKDEHRRGWGNRMNRS